MVSEKFIKRISKRDPLLAQKFRQKEKPTHQPVWDNNNLTVTRTLSPKEIAALENWIHA